jgi:hypothetical protein
MFGGDVVDSSKERCILGRGLQYTLGYLPILRREIQGFEPVDPLGGTTQDYRRVQA